jgi:tRNA (cmo5U34)-methyltransferase
MVEETATDRLYAEPRAQVADFVFDDQVAAVFPDMLRRSIPGYATIIRMIGLLAGNRVPEQGLCYDLGCSLGAAALAMGRAIRERQGRIIALDNSPAMIERASALLAEEQPRPAISYQLGDIREAVVDEADLVVLNFTLQFVPPVEREGLLRRIHQGLRPGGLLVLSEKIAFQEPDFQELFSQMHLQFKRDRGYSELEVSQKRSALERVLIPETLGCHQQRLRAVGFHQQALWFQCFNFISLLALK